jgi:hypothetical protein
VGASRHRAVGEGKPAASPRPPAAFGLGLLLAVGQQLIRRRNEGPAAELATAILRDVDYLGFEMTRIASIAARATFAEPHCPMGAASSTKRPMRGPLSASRARCCSRQSSERDQCVGECVEQAASSQQVAPQE